MKEHVVFIIVTYMPAKKTLQSLLQELRGWVVIVIDNTKKNLGYGGGANVGMRYALARGAQWLVVMNDDLELSQEAVTQFCQVLTQAPPGVVGPFAGELDKRRWTTIYPSQKVDYISGSFIAIHRQVIERIGYFYDPYFIYYEEVDYCLRAKQAGFPLIHVPLKGIKHQESATMGQKSFLHEYYHARNHLLFVDRQAPLGIKLYEYLRLPKTVWEHYYQKESGGLLGIRDYFLCHFGGYQGKL